MNPETSPKNKHFALSVRQMTAAALMTALMCLLGPLALPIGPVPISLTNFVILIAVYTLGAKLGLISYLAYLLLGTAGLPVFSGYTGGIAKLAGPTGGYLVGFCFTLVISGIFIKNSHCKTAFSILGMTIGMLIAYAFGTAWFVLEAKCTLWYALTVCVFPFFIGDAIKILLASKIGPVLLSALSSAHLTESL